jgi:hypothetical protein
LNETAVKSLDIEGDPIGQKIGNTDIKTIIGIVKDFNLLSCIVKFPPLRYIYQKIIICARLQYITNLEL